MIAQGACMRLCVNADTNVDLCVCVSVLQDNGTLLRMQMKSQAGWITTPGANTNHKTNEHDLRADVTSIPFCCANGDGIICFSQQLVSDQ